MSSGEIAFLTWARQSAVALNTVNPGPPWDDLTALDAMVGDAKVVALSEAVHCGAEPLDFRNRLFEYLVERKGFTAIAIESGIVEGRCIHDYVRGGTGDLQSVLAQGIGWTFDRLPQNEALIRWLRLINADPRRTRKVNFYGFDVPGSPPNGRANRGVDTALTEALAYLSRVDRPASTRFHERVASVMGRMQFDLRRSPRGPGYERLVQAERDALTAAIADLVNLFERCEAQYAAASTRDEYAWAYRAAVGARQVDAWLRHVPVGWEPIDQAGEPRGEAISFFPLAHDVRDRAQADNLEWVIEQEGQSGKLLVFAARYHLSAAPVKSTFWGRNGMQRQQEVAGAYLRRRLGKSLLTIGNLIGEARTDLRKTLHRAPGDSFDGVSAKVGPAVFVLDLRPAPLEVRKWLQQEQGLSDGSQVLLVAPAEAFDVLLYIATVTPASEADGRWHQTSATDGQ